MEGSQEKLVSVLLAANNRNQMPNILNDSNNSISCNQVLIRVGLRAD